MKTYIDCSSMYLPFLGQALDYTPSARAVCICCVSADTREPLAGVVYDGYNGAIIMAHIWVKDSFSPSRDWLAAIFDYPFNRLGVVKIVGQVNECNEEARKLDEHFGFELECKVSEYYPNGAALLVYTMTKEQCRILNSPRWAKTVHRVMGA